MAFKSPNISTTYSNYQPNALEISTENRPRFRGETEIGFSR